MTRTLLDTGPLAAFLNRNDQWHTWARTQMGALPPHKHERVNHSPA